MPKVTFEGRVLDCTDTVLDSLTVHGVPIPHACRAGVCQSCLMQAIDGTPPVASQKGLKDTLKAQNYFLACACTPDQDLVVALPGTALGKVKAAVLDLAPLSKEIMRVRLARAPGYDARPGQFLNLYHDDGLVRSYSIASLPDEGYLELHVRRIAAGQMSNWIHDQLRVGDTVDISAARGDSFYLAGRPDQALLLIGTGSGLAPLYGILRDALAQGHSGPIWLFHGSRHARGLYLIDALRALAASYPNFHYVPCISGREPAPDACPGRANEVALQLCADLKNWRIFLCGNPDMVGAAKRKAFLAGAALTDIFADPFSYAVPAAPNVATRTA